MLQVPTAESRNEEFVYPAETIQADVHLYVSAAVSKTHVKEEII
jgi:hypothetical protein